MSFPREEGASRAWAKALALFVLALPLFNPDIFWHLNAGRWIVAHGAVPRVDPFSFTRHGEPWVDFEWLFQVVVYAVHSISGLWGLRLFKAAVLGLSWLPIGDLLKRRGAGAAARGLALIFWAAAILPQSDLRPDLFSLLFFSIILARLDRDEFSWKFSLPLFALWSNLHAGFVLGLCLYVAKAGASFAESRKPLKPLYREAAAAVLGTLLNPFGARVWEVSVLHGAQSPALNRYIQEWGALTISAPLQWSLHAALLIFLTAAWRHRRGMPSFLALSALALAAATAFSVRFGLFFAASGAALLFAVETAPSARAAWAGPALLSALVAWPLSRVPWNKPFADTYVATRAIEFIVREEAAFKGLRLFNTYEWGGYLGWRRPKEAVFGDGRYLFSSQLPELEAALGTAGAFAGFTARYRLEGFLIKNYPHRLPTKRLYKDGTAREFFRPWYLFLLPRERWALVYFDEQALLFVDRDKISAAWLAAHEYRYLRPGDEDAFADARARREFPESVVRAEVVRHDAERR